MDKIWSCKIGETDEETLDRFVGADGPMRRAVERAYIEVTGREPDFIFSGWGAELDEEERNIVNEQLKLERKLCGIAGCDNKVGDEAMSVFVPEIAGRVTVYICDGHYQMIKRGNHLQTSIAL